VVLVIPLVLAQHCQCVFLYLCTACCNSRASSARGPRRPVARGLQEPACYAGSCRLAASHRSRCQPGARCCAKPEATAATK
jgi:hypothetical protein